MAPFIITPALSLTHFFQITLCLSNTLDQSTGSPSCFYRLPNVTRCQFYHHFISSFLCTKVFLQLFSSYIWRVTLCWKNSAQKLLVKCWWKLITAPPSSSAIRPVSRTGRASTAARSRTWLETSTRLASFTCHSKHRLRKSLIYSGTVHSFINGTSTYYCTANLLV